MYVVYKVDAGCEFESFEIDKVDDTESGDLILGYAYKSFTMPASDIEISISCIEVEPVYSVTIGSVTNGTVTAAPNKELEEGDTVVLVTVGDVKEYKTVFGKKIPVSWYMLKTLTVTDENGNEVTVSNYTFKMPAGNVTITATFE